MLGDASIATRTTASLTDVEWRRCIRTTTATRSGWASTSSSCWERGPAALGADRCELVEQARYALRSASLPALMYSRLKLEYAAGTSAPCASISRRARARRCLVRSEWQATVRARACVVHARGISRGEHDRQVRGMEQFAEDAGCSASGRSTCAQRCAHDEMLKIYEQDYIRAWDGVLRDVTLRPATDTRAGRRARDRLEPDVAAERVLCGSGGEHRSAQRAADPRRPANPRKRPPQRCQRKPRSWPTCSAHPPPGAENRAPRCLRTSRRFARS